MVLEKSPTSATRNLPEDFTQYGQECQKATQVQSNRERKDKITESSVFNTKEGHARREIHCGPFNIEQMYKVQNIQDAINEANSITPAKTFLDSGTGLKRRVLAHSHYPTEKALLRFPLPRPNLALQGFALWPQYWASDLHKIDSPYCQSSGFKRHLVPPFLGRYTHHMLYKGTMPQPYQNSSFNPEIFWMDPQHKEIPVGARSSIRLAGSAFQSDQSHSTSNKRENRFTSTTGKLASNLEIHIKKNNYENTRSSKLDRSIRSSNKSTYVKNKSFIEDTQKTKIRYKNLPFNKYETKFSQMGEISVSSTTTGKSNTKLHSPNRCLVKRLRLQDQQTFLQRRLRSHSKVLNQRLGITDSLVCTFENNIKGSSDPHTLRQLHSSGSSKKVHIDSVPSPNDFGAYLEESYNNGLDPINISYTRPLQCSGRSAVKEHNTVNRVVTAPTGFQTSSMEGEQEPSSGHLCHTFKPSTENLHLTLPGPNGNSSRCNDSQLGEVGSPISVSSYQFDFEGFAETSSNEVQDSHTNNTRDADTAMVHGPAPKENSVQIDPGNTSTNGSHQDGRSIESYQTSRLELIKASYNKRYPDCSAAVNLMAAPLRKSSISDYQHKWKVFMSFLKDKDIPFENVTIANVLQFFWFLFDKKHFKPGTLAHYRTALTVPLKEKFNIDLKIQAVTDLVRGMWLERPNMPSQDPHWSLNNVLTFVENMQEPLSETMLLRKTALLLLLATGYRISEMHACVRNEYYCKFGENSSLFIRPHPVFLAKNESPRKRWTHKEIKVLRLNDGSISKLCPVTTLKDYLNFTSDKQRGELLLTPGNHQKKLALHQLRYHICSLIFQGDDNHSKAHDVRTYASSCGLAETMLVGDLVSAFNWSSPATFLKHYIRPTDPLTETVALPVQKESQS